MTKIILPLVIFGLVLVSFILVYFYWNEKKRILVPAGLWLVFIAILSLSSLLCLFDLPREFTRTSLNLMVLSLFVSVVLFACFSIIVPILLVLDYIKKQSAITSYIAWGSLWLYLVLILSVFLSNKIRMNTFRAEGEKLQPLIERLEQYETKNKSYPRTLDVIDLKYSNNIYPTGMLGYPHLVYHPLKSSPDCSSYCSYRLSINCPVGMMRSEFKLMTPYTASRNNAEQLGEWRYILMDDRFEYWPGQDYPTRNKREIFTKLGKWVYIRKLH